jgi:CubicO group peptidase (beta-lactamase class C family)
MRTRAFAPALAVACAGIVCLSAQTRPVPAQKARVAAALDQFGAFYEARLAAQGIVGSSVLLLSDHQPVYQRTYGLADLSAKRPVDTNTIFHWASITKTFTGIAIMQLRDRGRLSLDDPIVKYLPELREVYNPFGPMEAVTIRMLMSHTSGFRMGTWPWGGDEPWQPFEPMHWSQLVAMMPYTRIEFPPGSKYSYSNPGVIFLGRVIELLTTDDYEVYVDKNILKPLGMYRSYFDATPYHLLPYRSHSYAWKDGAPVEARFDHNTGITVSNGGLNAPLTDMALYLDFLIGNPAKQAVYEGVLTRASLEEMWKPVADVESSPDGTVKMGLSFFLEERGGLPFVAHSGGQNSFISHFFVQPASRFAYVIAFNTAAEPVGPDHRGDTRLVDREIRDYLVRNVIPLLRAP